VKREARSLFRPLTSGQPASKEEGKKRKSRSRLRCRDEKTRGRRRVKRRGKGRKRVQDAIPSVGSIGPDKRTQRCYSLNLIPFRTPSRGVPEKKGEKKKKRGKKKKKGIKKQKEVRKSVGQISLQGKVSFLCTGVRI